MTTTSIELRRPHRIDEPIARKRLPLGELLVRAGVVTPAELEIAIGQHTVKKTKLGETLLEMGSSTRTFYCSFLRNKSVFLLPDFAKGLSIPPASNC